MSAYMARAWQDCIRQGYKGQQYEFFITLTTPYQFTNRYTHGLKDNGCKEFWQYLLKEFAKYIDKSILGLGESFYKKESNLRSFFIAIPEKLYGLPHFHLFLCLPKDCPNRNLKLCKIMLSIDKWWSELEIFELGNYRPKVELYDLSNPYIKQRSLAHVKPLANSIELERSITYIQKELFKAQNQELITLASDFWPKHK